MDQRCSIPVIYWPKIVEAAQAAGLTIDNDTLVRAHQRSEAEGRTGAAA